MQTTVTAVNMMEEEYIQFELQSDIRHEYVNGQLIDMPGGYLKNNRIAGNLYFKLRLALGNVAVNIFTHDAKLRIPGEKIYFYPDLFVTREALDDKQYIASTAILIAEVVSKTTKAYDAFDKLLQYKKIPELHYYLMIEPFKKIVTLISRISQNEWQTEFFNGPEETIELPAINVKFKLSDLYE